MTEKEFQTANTKLRRRQSQIRAARKETGPVRIGEIISDVLVDILQRGKHE